MRRGGGYAPGMEVPVRTAWVSPMVTFDCMYACISVRPYLMCIPLHTCIPLYTSVYPCIPLHTSVYPFIPRIPLHTSVYPCILLFTPAYSCIPLHTPVYPCTTPGRYMFWTDWGARPLIGRSALDGSGRIDLVTTNLKYINALAIDFDTNTLYWADAYTDVIETSDLNGR